MIDLTKPFEVGKMYRRVDGVQVICTQVKNDLKGYETAQFSDFVESFERAMAPYWDDQSTLDFMKRCDPTGWNDPTKSGHRYNRAEDRGRCTGSKWNGFAVIPEPRDAEHVQELFDHLRLSFES